MAPLTVFDQIALHPFLNDLPSGWLRRLAVHGHMVIRHPGYRLFTEDAPADRFWLLRSGSISLEFHVPGRGDIVVERIGGDGVVGWSWLLPPYGGRSRRSSPRSAARSSSTRPASDG